MTAQPNGCLSLDGDEVYYETAGRAGAPVVVLGHGAGGNHAIWFQQVPVFASGYRVVTWDQRGFGLSTNRDGRANPRTATSDLRAILDHLDVERAHVVGQSLGGWAAMGLAIAHPDRVQSLVLADTLGGIPVEGWRKARTITPRQGPFNHPALANDFCARHPERAHLYLEIGGLRRDPHSDPMELLRALGDVTFDDAQLGTLSMPTLFIVGSEDDIFPPEWIADAAARVPGARVETVEGAGHSPYFEQPDVWNSLVTDFWPRSP